MQTPTFLFKNEQSRQAFLRRTLQANGLFSLLSGLAFVLAAGPIARFVGPDIPPFIVLGIGLSLLPFGILVYRVAAGELQRAKFITMMDIGWVIGSFSLLFFGWSLFDVAGRWLIGLQAEVVATFALLQIIGLKGIKAK